MLVFLLSSLLRNFYISSYRLYFTIHLVYLGINGGMDYQKCGCINSWLLCVCVCACVRACVRVCVCDCLVIVTGNKKNVDDSDM